MTTPLGPLFIAIFALAINLTVTLIGTAIAYSMGWRPKSKITQEEIIKTAQ
jgi:SSS family solute:Na+ symporter